MTINNLENLRAFLTVVEERSYKKAAERLHVSQPTISFRVRTLEEELKCKLLFRERKNFLITDIGRFTYRIGKEMLVLEKQIEKHIKHHLVGDENRLTLGSGSTIGVYLLPHIISLYRQEHPQAYVDLQISSSEETLRKLLNNSIDIGFLGLKTRHEDVKTYEFLEYELASVAPPDHPLSTVESIKAVQLKNYNFVMREKGSLIRRILSETLKSNGLVINNRNIVMELNSTEALKESVEAGLGISFIAPWAIKLQLAAGSLVTLKIEDLVLKREICVAINKRGIHTESTENFLSFLRSRRLAKKLKNIEGLTFKF